MAAGGAAGAAVPSRADGTYTAAVVPEYGAPDVFKLEERPMSDLSPAADEVLLEVMGACEHRRSSRAQWLRRLQHEGARFSVVGHHHCIDRRWGIQLPAEPTLRSRGSHLGCAAQQPG